LESLDRNKIARAGFEAAKKSKPAAIFTADLAALVSVGNFEDDLAKLKDCDLIHRSSRRESGISASFTKGRTAPAARAVIASNTSGIRSSSLPKDAQKTSARTFSHALLNPPRYMHLVELIRTEWTKPESFVRCSASRRGLARRGRREGPANFIPIRIGTFGALVTIRAMLDDGYSIEEVDKITARGRPAKTATFRTFDLVGLSVCARRAQPAREPA